MERGKRVIVGLFLSGFQSGNLEVETLFRGCIIIFLRVVRIELTEFFSFFFFLYIRCTRSMILIFFQGIRWGDWIFVNENE